MKTILFYVECLANYDAYPSARFLAHHLHPAVFCLIVTTISFHWLKVPERIEFKLATIVYRLLNGTAPHYLAADLRRLSDMPSR